MQSLRWKRRAAALVAVTPAFLALQVVGPQAAAEGCENQDWCDVETGPNGGSVSVHLSGTGVSTGSGSSTSVPPDCWFQDGVALEPALAQRRILAIFEYLLPILQLPLHSVADYEAALEAHPNRPNSDYDDWKWYWLKCKPGFDITSDEALSVSEATNWYGLQVARLDKLLQTGQPNEGGVSVETLLQVAQDAFTIPEPEIQQSPAATDENGATLVNLDTWFWSEEAQASYTITATAGPVSVTLTAENTGYKLVSPAGGADCTYEQFTTKWSEELNSNPDAGCTIAFSEPSTGDGHEVSVSSTWDVTWTATGINGTNTLDPITPSSTITVPVVEQWGDVTDVH